jgi:hypothetical protein
MFAIHCRHLLHSIFLETKLEMKEQNISMMHLHRMRLVKIFICLILLSMFCFIRCRYSRHSISLRMESNAKYYAIWDLHQEQIERRDLLFGLYHSDVSSSILPVKTYKLQAESLFEIYIFCFTVRILQYIYSIDSVARV